MRRADKTVEKAQTKRRKWKTHKKKTSLLRAANKSEILPQRQPRLKVSPTFRNDCGI